MQGVVIDVYSPGEGAALIFPDGSQTCLDYKGGRFWGRLTPWRVDVDDMAECWARRVFGGPRGHEAATDEDMKLFDECCEAIKRSGNTGA